MEMSDVDLNVNVLVASNKKLLGVPGIATRSKDATIGAPGIATKADLHGKVNVRRCGGLDMN